MNIWLSENFYGNIKTKRLIASIGSDAVICLHRLWFYAAKYAVDNLLEDDKIGILKDFTAQDIELIAEWKGEEGSFVKVVESQILIEKRYGQYFIHDFLHNNPYISVLIKQKIAGSKYGRKRKEDKDKGDLIGDLSSDLKGESIATEHNITEQNITEDKNIASEIPKPDKKKELAEQIINHFNKITGRDNGTKRPITLTGKTKSQIMARIKEGYKLNDFVHVIEVCYYNWIDDKEFKGRIHPQVIFNNEMDKRLVWEKKDKSREGLTRD
jgi:uncharacterized phage protein (TIGR02220 family)